MSLTLNNLTFKPTNEYHLNDISLHFEPGKMYTILGRTLSGKTTLLKTIAGLLTPDSGYHAINKIEDKPKPKASTPALETPPQKPRPKYQAVFGRWLCDMAAQDDRLVAITPAMCEGSGMVEFAERFPERYHDVAIAEQHAVSVLDQELAARERYATQLVYNGRDVDVQVRVVVHQLA